MVRHRPQGNPTRGSVWGELDRAVCGDRRRRGWFGWWGLGRRCGDRFRDWPLGGRGLSWGRGARLGLRASSGRGTVRVGLRSLALRSLRPAPITPTPRHPPEAPLELHNPRCRRSLNLREPDIRRQRRWLRSFEQLWGKLQRQKQKSSTSQGHGGPRPAHTKAHPGLRPQPPDLTPAIVPRRFWLPPANMSLF